MAVTAQIPMCIRTARQARSLGASLRAILTAAFLLPFLSSSFAQQVDPVGPVRIVVRPQNSNVAVNGQLQLQVYRAFFTGVGKPGGERLVDTTGNQTVFWYSNTGSANVTPYSGLVTGASIGGTTITAFTGPSTAYNGLFSGQTNVNVGLTGITVTPANPSIPLGTNIQFIATGNFGGTPLNITDSVNWTTSDPSVFITNQPGFRGFAISLVPHAQPYSVTITATSGAVSGQATLNITAPIPAAVNITPASATLSCCPFTQLQFHAIATLTDGTVQDMSTTAAWNTNDGGIVTVANGANGGLATSVAHGITSIYCTVPGQFGSADVTVTTTLQAISVSPITANLEVGDTLQLRAMGTYTDSTQQDVTTIATWTSDAIGVATVDPSGLVTGAGTGGPAHISATLNGIFNTSNITGITATLKPRFAYVVNSGDYTVSTFIVDPVTGQLRPNGYMLSENAPKQMVLDAQQRFAYLLETTGTVAPCSPSCVVQFSIDYTTGKLTPVGTPMAAGVNPVVLALEPQGFFLYVANSGGNTISGYSVSGMTGALTPIPGAPFATGANPSSIDFDTGGRHAYVTNQNSTDVWTYSINPANGALTTACTTMMSCTPTGATPHWITVRRDPSGAQPPKDYAYVTYAGANQIWKYDIDATTGALSNAPTMISSGGNFPYFLAIHPSNSLLYAINGGSDNITTFSINGTTGVLTQVGGAVTAGTNIDWLTIDPSGSHVYTTNNTSNDVSLFNINGMTGALTAATTVSPATRVRVAPFDIVFTSGTTRVKYKPQYAYVANFGSNNVSAYSIIAADGKLIPLAVPTYLAGSSPAAIAAEPSSRYLYAANRLSNNVSAYGIKSADGSLTPLATSPPPPYPGGGEMNGMAVDPSGSFVYIGKNTSSELLNYQIDFTPGNAGFLNGPYLPSVTGGFPPVAVAVDPTGRFLFTASRGNNQVRWFITSQYDGTLTFPMPNFLPAGTGADSIAVEPSGRFVYVGAQDGSISQYSINAANGSLTFLGAVANGSDPYTLVMDLFGRFLYTTNINANTVSGYVIDPVSGALTVATNSPWAAGAAPVAASIDPSGTYLYVASEFSNEVIGFSIDPATGNLTYVPNVRFAAGNFPFGIATTGTLASATVTLNSITVSPANSTIGIGIDQQFTATGTFSNGTTQDLSNSVTWSSTAAGVATISNTAGSQGLARSLAAGATSIRATSGVITGSTNLSVTGATLKSITIAPLNSSMPLGGTRQFTATGHFSDNSSSDITDSVQWLSTNTAIATISNAAGTEGRATGVAAGTTSIRASLNGIIGSTNLTVVTLTSITVTPPNPTRAPGQTQQFVAIGTFSDASSGDITNIVIWTSDTPAVAFISPSGLAQAVATGTSTITATSGPTSGNTMLTVGGAVLTNIQVTPSNTTIINNGSRQYTATGVFSDGSTQNLTNSVTWSSTNLAAATISNTGLATACGNLGCSGKSTQIRATFNGITGMATLNVR